MVDNVEISWMEKVTNIEVLIYVNETVSILKMKHRWLRHILRYFDWKKVKISHTRY